MLGAIKYHFRHLADFSGRDARQTFWYWFLFLFLVQMAVSLLVTMPLMASGMTAGIRAAQANDPGAIERTMLLATADALPRTMAVMSVVGIASVALMAAAFVRRLHDSGKPAVWALVTGLVYLGALAYGWFTLDATIAMIRDLAASGEPGAMSEFQRRSAAGTLLSYAPYVLLIVFGVMKSDPGPNKYGAEPVRF